MLTFETLKKVRVDDIIKNLDSSILALKLEIEKITLDRTFDEPKKALEIHNLIGKWFRHFGRL